MKITVCVIYPRYPDNTEPLGGFVESEETSREIDNWWRSRPGGMIGTWEDFEVEVESRDQLLYGVFSGTPTLEIDNPNFWNPICHGIYTDPTVAEKASQPETMWEANNCPPKFVLPFRLGWKFDRYYPDGKPWPPDKL